MNKEESEILWKNKEFLAKGKRGFVYVSSINGKKFLLKSKNPDSEALGKIRIESTNNKKLNTINVGPKFLFYNEEKDFLVREFVDGLPVFDWIEKNPDKKFLLFILKDVFSQCYEMDKIKMNKFEMTNPYKDIIISNNKPFIIDFERCRFVERPKNVTQFCQFLAKGKMFSELEKLGVDLEKEVVMMMAEKYKISYSKKDYDEIITYLTKIFR